MSYQNGDLDITLLNGEQVEQVKDDPEFTSVAPATCGTSAPTWTLCRSWQT